MASEVQCLNVTERWICCSLKQNYLENAKTVAERKITFYYLES